MLLALFAADGPVSAPDVADGLGGHLTACNISSVYRNLQDLEALGVVRQVHIADGPALYALEGGGRHEYLFCERCERVQAVDASRLDRVHAEIRDALNYQTSSHVFRSSASAPYAPKRTTSTLSWRPDARPRSNGLARAMWLQ